MADLTNDWRTRAIGVLGQDATAWARTVTDNDKPLLLRADDVPLDAIADLGQTVVEVVGQKRSTWRRWNLTAEASRQTMGWHFATMQDREAVVAMIADAAENASLRLTPPDLVTSPAMFRRTDGTSVFRPKHSTVFSSEQLLAAEDRLLDRSRTMTAPTVPMGTLEKITSRPDVDGRMFCEDQTDALMKVAVSGRMLDVLVGPPGAGKTTAMNALRRAWETEHGKGSVVGLAPSAVAAQVLADDLGIQTENTAKWWQNHLVHGTTFEATFRSVWTLSARTGYDLRRYMPTSRLLDAIRRRHNLRWGIPAMFLAAPYLLIARICTGALAAGAPGRLHLLVLWSVWNAMKFVTMGRVSLVLLIRALIGEAVVRRRDRTGNIPNWTMSQGSPLTTSQRDSDRWSF